MDLTRYLNILWRRKWIVVLVGLLTPVLVYVGIQQLPQSYIATATMRILTPTTGLSPYASVDLGYTDRLRSTYVQVITSERTLDDYLTRTGQSDVPKVGAEVVPLTELLTVSVESENADDAIAAVNSYSEYIVANAPDLFRGPSVVTADLLQQRRNETQADLDEARAIYEQLIDDNTPPVADQVLAAEVEAARRAVLELEGRRESLRFRYEDALIAEAATIAQAPLLGPTPNVFLSSELYLERLEDAEASLVEARATYLRLLEQSILPTVDPVAQAEVEAAGRRVFQLEGVLDTLQYQYEDALVGEALALDSTELVERASFAVPTRPDPTLLAALGLVTGLVGGAVLALVVENLDRRLYTLEDVASFSDVPVLGRTRLRETQQSPDAALRRVLVAIDAAMARNARSAVTVVKPQRAYHGATAATLLALASAEAGRRTLLIDADTLDGTIARRYELPTVNLGGEDIEARATPQENLFALAVGSTETDATALVAAPQSSVLMARPAFEQFDMAWVNTPPFDHSADAAAWAAMTGAAVVVVDLGRTRHASLRDVLNQLRLTGTHAVGIIVNEPPLSLL